MRSSKRARENSTAEDDEMDFTTIPSHSRLRIQQYEGFSISTTAAVEISAVCTKYVEACNVKWMRYVGAWNEIISRLQARKMIIRRNEQEAEKIGHREP
jgi:hypothetical protein